jgi:hypothetical protein
LQRSSEFLSLAPVSDSDIFKAIKRFKPSKFVGVDDIPGFIIKGCTDIFVSVLRHIFNLSLSQQYFLTLWTQAAIVPVSKKNKIPVLAITDQHPILIMLPNYFNLLYMTRFCIYLKFRFSPYQHGFSESKSALINVVTYVDLISPLVGSQSQADASYFDLSNAFDLVPHSLLLHKHSASWWPC